MAINNDGFEANTQLTFEEVQALARKHREETVKVTTASIPKKQSRDSGVMSQEFAKTAIK